MVRWHFGVHDENLEQGISVSRKFRPSIVTHANHQAHEDSAVAIFIIYRFWYTRSLGWWPHARARTVVGSNAKRREAKWSAERRHLYWDFRLRTKSTFLRNFTRRANKTRNAKFARSVAMFRNSQHKTRTQTLEWHLPDDISVDRNGKPPEKKTLHHT